MISFIVVRIQKTTAVGSNMQKLLITTDFHFKDIKERTDLIVQPLTREQAAVLTATYVSQNGMESVTHRYYDAREFLKNGLPYDVDVLCMGLQNGEKTYTYVR
jgi:hypothetical protein